MGRFLCWFGIHRPLADWIDDNRTHGWLYVPDGFSHTPGYQTKIGAVSGKRMERPNVCQRCGKHLSDEEAGRVEEEK